MDMTEGTKKAMTATEVQEKMKEMEALLNVVSRKVSAGKYLADSLERAINKGPVAAVNESMNILIATVGAAFKVMPVDNIDEGIICLTEDIIRGLNRGRGHKTTISVRSLIAENVALKEENTRLQQRCETLETTLMKEEG